MPKRSRIATAADPESTPASTSGSAASGAAAPASRENGNAAAARSHPTNTSVAEDGPTKKHRTQWDSVLHKLLSYYCKPDAGISAAASKQELENNEDLRAFMGPEAHDHLKKSYFAQQLTEMRRAGIHAQTVARRRLGEGYKQSSEAQLDVVLADETLSGILRKWGLEGDNSFVLKLLQPTWPKAKASGTGRQTQADPPAPPAPPVPIAQPSVVAPPQAQGDVFGYLMRFRDKLDSFEEKLNRLESKIVSLDDKVSSLEE